MFFVVWYSAVIFALSLIMLEFQKMLVSELNQYSKLCKQTRHTLKMLAEVGAKRQFFSAVYSKWNNEAVDLASRNYILVTSCPGQKTAKGPFGQAAI